MLYVGIDVASEKHDCCILGCDGTVLVPNLTFSNSYEGFETLYKTILSLAVDNGHENIKVGLEATGHYSINLVSFLRGKGLNITVFNPLHVNLYRKAQSLRKTKTDKTDARFLAVMLFSDDFKSYSQPSYQISELKSLVRNRFRLVEHRSRLKTSVARLVTILFPELKAAVWSIHQVTSYELLLAYPTAASIAKCHITKLTNLLSKASVGRYGKDKANTIKSLAAKSIGQNSPSVAFELQQTIRLIRHVQVEIDLLDEQIETAVIALNSPILSIPGISYTLGGIILAEIGEISNFKSPAKLLAFAGLEPSTYQSGKYTATNTPMVKHGSAYLRWAFINAARTVSMRDETFKTYLAKKRAEGKHYYVALSHTAKKLSRIVFHLLATGSSFEPQTPQVRDI